MLKFSQGSMPPDLKVPEPYVLPMATETRLSREIWLSGVKIYMYLEGLAFSSSSVVAGGFQWNAKENLKSMFPSTATFGIMGDQGLIPPFVRLRVIQSSIPAGGPTDRFDISLKKYFAAFFGTLNMRII